MTPTDLKELMIQLKDLVHKGFIKPSVPHIPVLFVKKKY